MHLDHVVFPHLPRGHPAKGRRDSALAQSKCDRHTQHVHAVHLLATRQAAVVLRCHDRHLMAAPPQGARQPLRIYGQTGCMRAIVREHREDPHEGAQIILRLPRALIQAGPPSNPA